MDALPKTSLTQVEAAILEEQGGYSGPQLFPSHPQPCRKKYRRMLDYPLHETNGPQLQPQDTTLPAAAILTPKVIFCTGGITNGQQTLEALDAGASVTQIYTALIYGGVGKITAMKQEMRHRNSRERE
jgi:dihydroorotate dehydrogenase